MVPLSPQEILILGSEHDEQSFVPVRREIIINLAQMTRKEVQGEDLDLGHDLWFDMN